MIMNDIVYMLSSKVHDGYLSPRPLSEGIAIVVLVTSEQNRRVLPCQRGGHMVNEY